MAPRQTRRRAGDASLNRQRTMIETFVDQSEAMPVVALRSRALKA
ncbi:MAG: hypothetical protein QOI92_84 [Chloroflexota bacterium]|jgi:hypothetical protein|nr:hypothetical protein [Chloroflexota bacterium]